MHRAAALLAWAQQALPLAWSLQQSRSYIQTHTHTKGREKNDCTSKVLLCSAISNSKNRFLKRLPTPKKSTMKK
jgi:hypothetical protein